MTKYRVGQIGCSPGRGKDHARAFTDNADRFDLVAICDRDEERLGKLSSEYPGQGQIDRRTYRLHHAGKI